MKQTVLYLYFSRRVHKMSEDLQKIHEFPPETWKDMGTYWLSNAEQGSQEWLDSRKFRITSTSMAAASGLSNFSNPKKEAMKIAGVFIQDFDEAAKKRMQHGTDTEPIARDWYMNKFMVDVKEVGLAVSKEHHMIGASADGFVEGNGLLEIKCPQRMYRCLSTKPDNIDDPYYHDHIYNTHYCQMQSAMAVTGRHWCSYLVYCGPSDVHCERVLFNKKFWEETLLPNALEMYEKYVIPCVLHGVESIL